MSDPRYTDPANDPRRTSPRDPAGPGPSRYTVEDDAGRGGMWAWIVGIIAVIVIAMLVYDYNRPISTATNPPVNPPSTTGAAPPASPALPSPASPSPAPLSPASPSPAPAPKSP
jgi:hypothetical protein